jgi:hypothetical protein
MSTIPNRVTIYPKDVMNITGRRERTARKLLTHIRKKNKKGKGAFVTVEEFCQFTGINQTLVVRFLL